MSMSMLDYSKLILENVGFDAMLFQKELRKAFQRLLEPEAEELMIWCIARYNFP
jgi:hypothetical protein